jgi:hypothetical protein
VAELVNAKDQSARKASDIITENHVNLEDLKRRRAINDKTWNTLKTDRLRAVGDRLPYGLVDASAAATFGTFGSPGRHAAIGHSSARRIRRHDA